jgi:hypothetical protein
MLAIFLLISFPYAAAGSQVVTPLIGSNFIWYDLNYAECTVGHPAQARDQYAVIAGYSTNDGRLTTDSTLRLMRQNGQEIIALGLFHEHGASGKTILNSTGGDLSPEARSNLSSLIDTIVGLHFRVLYIRFFPFGQNFIPVTAEGALSIKTEIYMENLTFIQNVLHLANSKNIEVITDLCNECSPSSLAFDNPEVRLQARLMVYTRHLWRDYVRLNGPDHTVGFSIIPDKFRIANLPEVYKLAGVRPRMLDLHFYPSDSELNLLRCHMLQTARECEFANACARSPSLESCHPLFGGSLFDTVSRQLDYIGFNTPWIIGETFYNDPPSAAYLKMGMQLTHREVRYIFQWPLQRPKTGRTAGNSCDVPGRGGGINVGAPVSADAYLNLNDDNSTSAFPP